MTPSDAHHKPRQSISQPQSVSRSQRNRLVLLTAQVDDGDGGVGG